VSSAELVTLACCDLGAITRGRAVFADQLEEHMRRGIGWVPANMALTPLGPLADEDPFGSTGDLRLLPDADTRARVSGEGPGGALELLLCDIVETDGGPWDCCPRTFLADALAALRREFGLELWASFEHEFQLERSEPPPLPFSVQAQRSAEPFASEVMDALLQAGAEPERFFAEYAAHQFEIPLAPARGLAAADRAVTFREVVRELARRHGTRASFTPLLDPEQAGNGVHIHVRLLDDSGAPVLYDAARDGCVSELGASFAAGILDHARALCALTAPSPVSASRLQPHRWSAGAVALGERIREALLRIPPLVSLGGGELAEQMRFEYRGADAAANPYVALGALVHAGMEGLRARLPAPPILRADPASLPEQDAARFGVGALPSTLEDALAALAQDEAAAAWLPPRLYAAHVSIKRTEIDAGARLDPEELCRRYAAIY
jgi:glutamine synthetase